MAGDTNPTCHHELVGLQRTKVHLFYDKREGEDHTLNFYERNPAGQGLDLDDYPGNKSDFVRYAFELRCLNPVVDIKKTPLPPLEDLVEVVNVLLHVGLQHYKEPRKEIEKYYKQKEPRRSGYMRHTAPAQWA